MAAKGGAFIFDNRLRTLFLSKRLLYLAVCSIMQFTFSSKQNQKNFEILPCTEHVII